jgi:hypothetical protein
MRPDSRKRLDGRHGPKRLFGRAPRVWQAGEPAHGPLKLGRRQDLHLVDGDDQLFYEASPVAPEIPVVTPATDADRAISVGRHADQPTAREMLPVGRGRAIVAEGVDVLEIVREPAPEDVLDCRQALCQFRKGDGVGVYHHPQFRVLGERPPYQERPVAVLRQEVRW